MDLDTDTLYELMLEAARQVRDEGESSGNVQMHKRMLDGAVQIADSDGRLIKEVPVLQFFRKVTSVREKLRVLEQKLNNHKSLSVDEKAELQVFLTRSYGSLTTFNFLFAADEDRFKGVGGN